MSFKLYVVISDIGLRKHIAKRLQEAGCDDLSKVDSMCSHLLNSKSVNTNKKYSSGFKRWKTYCKSKGYCDLPARPILVAKYMTEILDSGYSYHTVSSIYYGIKWAHKLNGFKDPTKNSFVKNLLESSKRTAKKPTQKKDPIPVETIVELCDKHKTSDDLCVVRNLCMITMAYAGFLRFEELSNVKCCDVSIEGSYMKINLEKSKTDQYRFGSEILISRGKTSACPVNLLQKYIRLGNIDMLSDYYLFKPVFKSKSGSKLIHKDKKLSYSRTRECVLALIKTVAPKLNIGLHSLRSGGASVAANNNVSERCLKRHGRWKSDFAKDMYVADSLDKRLHISKSLNL